MWVGNLVWYMCVLPYCEYSFILFKWWINQKGGTILTDLSVTSFKLLQKPKLSLAFQCQMSSTLANNTSNWCRYRNYTNKASEHIISSYIYARSANYIPIRNCLCKFIYGLMFFWLMFLTNYRSMDMDGTFLWQ